MTFRDRNRQFRRVLRSMPVRSRVLLVMAIFLTFASHAIWTDSVGPDAGFWSRIVATALFSGAIGLGYAAAGFVYLYALPLVLALNLLGSTMLERWVPPRPEARALSLDEVRQTQARMRTLASVRMAMSLLAYTSFIGLLGYEGRRSIAAHTEIRLAREIHAALVPVTAGRMGDLEWYGVSHPSGEVGGDLVDVIGDPSGWTACVADVSGHGVAAGVLMGMFKTALRSAYRVSRDPGDVLSQVGEVLYPLKQANMFVTAAVLTRQDLEHFAYLFAGHPPAVHVSTNATEARWVGESQMAIGFVEGTRYVSGTLEMASGDLLALVTDGLIEVFNRKDQELGAARLLEIIRSAAARPALADAAAEVFAACARYGAQTDDQSLLLMRRATA